MPVELLTTSQAGHKILEVRVSGKLTRSDYKKFLPDVERLIREGGKMRLLLVMHDFHGWNGGALWEDIKFDIRHFSDIDRLAIVGEKTWEKWMAAFCRPFTTARVVYFDHAQMQEARQWLAQEDYRASA
jgi:hypothetical protein